MKSSKILILAFTLSFPVIIYLFLTFYGSNEFDLPVYFDVENEFCNDFKSVEEISDPLTGADQSTYQLEAILEGNINVVHFPKLTQDNKQLLNELGRLILTFPSEDRVKVHAFYDTQTSEYLLEDTEEVKNYELQKDFYSNLINCYWLLPTEKWAGKHPSEMVLEVNSTLLLLDQNGRIRGYYDGLETKDIDRLILEIRILMTKQSK